MASTFSFDIVSEIDMQEADNAVNQAMKEIAQRYDFKGSNTTLELSQKDKSIKIESGSEFQLTQAVDVLQSKLIKRGISLKALKFEPMEPATKGGARQTVKLQVGIDKENAKKITGLIKNSGVKVQAAIQDEQVRVTGKSKDDLQEIMHMLNTADLPFATQYTNYR